MAVEVIFPRVDMEMTSGKISHWFVGDGEPVEKGAPLFEIETDKAAMEIEAPASGIVRVQTEATQAEVPVGAPVAWIVAPGEAWAPVDRNVTSNTTELTPASRAEQRSGDDRAGRQAEAVPHLGAATPSEPAPLLRATPLARRTAAAHRVDLAAITGSGPRGRVLHADVLEAAATHRPAAPAPAIAQVRRTTLHLERFGPSEGTPIVLLHGFGSDHSSWHDIWRALENARPVVTLDLPGHGRSPTGQTDFADLVEAVLAALQEAGIHRCHLVGHSLGGAVALGVADTQRPLVRSLGLIAPAGFGPEIDAAFLSGFVAATQPGSMAPWLRRLFADPALVTDGFVRATLQAQATPGRRDHQRELQSRLFPDGTQALQLAGSLQQLTIPTKVIWGAADQIIPARHARGLPAHVAIHIAPGIGHMPQLEAPGLVSRLLGELAAAGE